jgi:hypothetical protein
MNHAIYILISYRIIDQVILEENQQNYGKNATRFNKWSHAYLGIY